MWIIRVDHPIKLSRIILIMVSKAILVSAVNIIERMSPEMIWSAKVKPSINPKFHNNEIEEGAGRSSRDFFSKFVIGFILISCFFI